MWIELKWKYKLCCPLTFYHKVKPQCYNVVLIPASWLPGSQPGVPAYGTFLSMSSHPYPIPALSERVHILVSSVWSLPVPLHQHMNWKVCSHERMACVGFLPLWLVEDRNSCSFYLLRRGSQWFTSRSAMLLKKECTKVSKFIIKLNINYFVLKCLKFFFLSILSSKHENISC